MTVDKLSQSPKSLKLGLRLNPCDRQIRKNYLLKTGLII